MLALPAMGGPILETLSPNVYTVFAGQAFTIGGTVFFPNPAAYAFGAAPSTSPANQDEFLFGVSPTGPQLEIVAGVVEFSLLFPGGSGGAIPAYFEDIYGQGGWLGPANFSGPGTTPVSDWRTFIVPVGTAPGVYDYTYGIAFSENGKAASEDTLFATGLQVDVVPTPEPAPVVLIGLGLVLLAAFHRFYAKKSPRRSSGIGTNKSRL
jgi:hypothetical protein